MPNHITNIVRIQDYRDLEDYKKQSAEFKAFAAKLRTEDSDFDFNAVVPMPAHSDNFFAKGNLGSEEEEKYGKNNWYDWSIEHWGTKWNSYEVVYMEDGEYLEILVKFETAWTPPVPVLKAIAKLGYRVDYSWVDEGDGDWHGWETIKAEVTQ